VGNAAADNEDLPMQPRRDFERQRRDRELWGRYSAGESC
jgi:hypothetical protein